MLAEVESPVVPEMAHTTFQVDEGINLELVAAEPLIASPVAMAWDDKGRLFVVENRGYPAGMPDDSQGGVIVMLEDMNKDRRMDKRTVFAHGFTFPNGILAWDGGFFVTCSPDVFFLKDTNGDGRADVRQVVLSGFDTSSSTQLRIAHPVFGPDGWVYLTSGLTRASNIGSPLHPDRAAVRIGSDSRFDPVTYRIEAVDGRGQFGQTFDDWGNRFHNMNRVHIQHTVLPSRFLQRNPDFPFTRTVQNVPEGMVDDLLKSRNVAARIYPISDNLTTADSHAGTFSAACSLHVYRGDGLSAEHYGDIFTCDPTGNLVHRDRLTPVGPTFSSRMVNEGREFLASRDNWFRPVFLATGPDGALYIADMYRKTIEHPDYLPDEVRKRTDFEAGRNQGRIWKVTSKVRNKRVEDPEIQRKNPLSGSVKQGDVRILKDPLAQWIRDLGHPNIWQRERAMKGLLTQREVDANKVMLMLLDALPGNDGKNDNEYFRQAQRNSRGPAQDLEAVHRVNRLNTAIAMSGWDPRESDNERDNNDLSREVSRKLFNKLISATMDPSPGVRLNAWLHLRDIPVPGLDVSREIVRSWVEDPDPAVRFQILLALGHWYEGRVTDEYIRLGLLDATDPWARAAFILGIKSEAQTVLNRIANQTKHCPVPELGYDLGHYFGKRDWDTAEGFRIDQLRLPNYPEAEMRWRIAWLGGMFDSIGPRVLRAAVNKRSMVAGFAQTDLTQAAIHAQSLINSKSETTLVKQSAATVLAFADKQGVASLLRWVKPDVSPELLRHVLGLIVDLGEPPVLEQLMSPPIWSSLHPDSRARVIDGLLRQETTANLLLASLQSDRVFPRTLSLVQRDVLRKRVSSELRDEVDSLFSEVEQDRMRIYEQYSDVAGLPGDAGRGREMFRLHCASCHRLDQEGFNVGPDLFGIRNQSKEAVLMHVLVPNREVYPGFGAVTIETVGDLSLTGIIRAETEDSVTLATAQGGEDTFSRSNITSFKVSEQSLMPDGFELLLGRAGLADLLAYLKGETPP